MENQGTEVQAGAALEYRQQVTSTNDVAIEAALAAALHGWAVCAGEQTAGRGRRGHVWASPEGSLYLSCVLRPQVPMQNFIAIPAVSAMGIIDALHGLGLSGRVGIKWPNDIVARMDDDGDFNRKLAGILVEARSSEEGPFAVVGMGVNLKPVNISTPLEGEETPQPRVPRPLEPVSLEELLAGQRDAGAADEDAVDEVVLPEMRDFARTLRDAVVARVDAWAQAVKTSPASEGPLAPILPEYFGMVPMLGHQVAVLSPTGHLMATGVFSGLDRWGRARVMTQAGEKSYPSEAVSLRAL